MKKKSLLASTALSVSILMCSGSYAYAVDGNSIKTKRLSGNDRYKTSIAVSKDGWNNGCDYVVLASGENYPDALCAVTLAKKYDAPVLLCPKNNISNDILSEIKRLGAKHIFIMGMQGALSDKVEAEVKKADSKITVERIGGKNRYETAVKVADKIDSSEIVLASGDNYADALSIAPIAAKKGIPVLLTGKKSLPVEVQKFIKSKSITKTYIIGQNGVISKEIENNMPNSERLGGKDRYKTNLQIINRFSKDINFKKVYAAVGGPGKKDFADALSGAALAAKNSSSIILTSKNQKKYSQEIIKNNLSEKPEIIALGGQSVLTDSVIDSIKINLDKKVSTKENNKDVNEKDKDNTSGANTPSTGGGTSSGSTTGGGKTSDDGQDKDSIKKVLDSINNASFLNMKQVLENNSKALGIDLEKYNTLNEGRKKVTASDMCANRPASGYKTANDVKEMFDDLVQTRVLIQDSLDTVNNAKSVDELKDFSFVKDVYDFMSGGVNYTKLSGKTLSNYNSVIKVQYDYYNELSNAKKEELLKKLIKGAPYVSYSQMLEQLM
ncbi:cell wall-binding repeat-containing protein [Haloimpatiens sp. FM7330]|uniref:cell wall-binding repeat-containing protein n=1 Tax=Haloimpatiens sp. FM7330 TaxID=3298610 RepID=UPI003625A765